MTRPPRDRPEGGEMTYWLRSFSDNSLSGQTEPYPSREELSAGRA